MVKRVGERKDAGPAAAAVGGFDARCPTHRGRCPDRAAGAAQDHADGDRGGGAAAGAASEVIGVPRISCRRLRKVETGVGQRELRRRQFAQNLRLLPSQDRMTVLCTDLYPEVKFLKDP